MSVRALSCKWLAHTALQGCHIPDLIMYIMFVTQVAALERLQSYLQYGSSRTASET